MTRPCLGSLLTLAILVIGLPTVAVAAPSNSSKVAVPTVTGPVTGGQGFPSLLTTNFELADVGYERAEYFVEGDATSYRPVGKLGSDGKWTVKAKDTAPYKTRIVVYRPIDPAKFSGTVFVEWFNVSAGFDVATDWIPMHTQLIRAGDAYVGVDAQSTGVQGGDEALPGATSGGIKAGDPERYGTLHHPGDAYAYDIFSQAGVAAAGHADGVNPLAGLDVQHVIATGESQSAFFLTSYVNAVHPLAQVYDGFLIHSRGGTAPGFEKFTQARVRRHAEERPHPHRRRRAGADPADRDGPHRARVPPGPSARQQALPPVGGRGHVARRPVHGVGRFHRRR